MKKMIIILLCLGVIGTLSVRTSLAEQFALSLVMDSSGSIDTSEYALQIQGYANAVASLVPTNGTVAISVIEFGQNYAVQIPWKIVDSDATRTGLANSISGLTRSGIDTSWTAIGDAITFANTYFGSLPGGTSAWNYFIIDVSTDGVYNYGSNPVTAAQNAVNGGLADVVNAIGIGTATAPTFNYGTNYDGSLAFSLLASDFGAFETALSEKFSREIPTEPVPEPATLLLLGSGLIGLAGYGRKKFFKK